MNTNIIQVNRALISVSDKNGLVDFARGLSTMGVEIISTGGTAKALSDAGIKVVEISNFTGFPEMMDGRVKTLHPLVHAGILGLRDKHAEQAKQQNIKWIDLVICNLYPFAEIIAKPNVTEEEAIENIDIGGPTMIRSAAKNFGWVGVVVDFKDYDPLLLELKTQGGLTYDTRKKLSAKAFAHTARYDAVITNYFENKSTLCHSERSEESLNSRDPSAFGLRMTNNKFPETLSLTFNKYYDLRYGENPHQEACVYKDLDSRLRGNDSSDCNILNAKIIQGKQLSFNNINDADGALATLKEFGEPACVVVKHANPCGVSIGDNITEVFKRAYNADALSAFGGIIALNRTCNKSIAEEIVKVFAEIVLAPDYEPEALVILAQKKNLRVLELGAITPPKQNLEFKYVNGGLLLQDTDTKTVNSEDIKIVTKKQPTKNELNDMLFAWKVLKHIKSNGILIAKNNTTLGVGAGQVSRVDAVDMAIKKSADKISGSILASDAFFPFHDSIDKIAPTGVKAIIQPGGSIKDQEVIDACDERGIAMVFTGVRCFKH